MRVYLYQIDGYGYCHDNVAIVAESEEAAAAEICERLNAYTGPWDPKEYQRHKRHAELKDSCRVEPLSFAHWEYQE